MTFNCTGLQGREGKTQEQLILTIRELEQKAWRPNIIALQECYKDRTALMKLKIEDYRPVTASAGMQVTALAGTQARGTRRGSVILVDNHLVVQSLDERSREKTELIGIKIVGDTTSTYNNPIDLWTAYSGPDRDEANTFVEMLTELVNSSINRTLLVGDMNSRYQPPKYGPGRNSGSLVPIADRCHCIIRTINKWEEEGNATILNEYGVPTTINGTTIDLAIILGQ